VIPPGGPVEAFVTLETFAMFAMFGTFGTFGTMTGRPAAACNARHRAG